MKVTRRHLRRLIESVINEQESKMDHGDDGGSETEFTSQGATESQAITDYKDSESRIGSQVIAKLKKLFEAMLPGLKDTDSIISNLKSAVLPTSFNVSHEKIKIIIHQIYKLILDDLVKNLGPKSEGVKLSNAESQRINGAWQRWIYMIDDIGHYKDIRKSKTEKGKKVPTLSGDMAHLYKDNRSELKSMHDSYANPWIKKTGYSATYHGYGGSSFKKAELRPLVGFPESANESLSRGSIYRRRYRRY
jgi:hypothetical protein